MIEQLGALSHEVIPGEPFTDHDHLFKLIIIGDTAVGKSCLTRRVMKNELKIEH
jgi:GTPase SAR1 family protein